MFHLGRSNSGGQGPRFGGVFRGVVFWIRTRVPGSGRPPFEAPAWGPRTRGNRIRTCGGTASPHFKCGALNRSAIPLPWPVAPLARPMRPRGTAPGAMGLGPLLRSSVPPLVPWSLPPFRDPSEEGTKGGRDPRRTGGRREGGRPHPRHARAHGRGRARGGAPAHPVSPKIRTWNDGSVDRSDGHFTKETRGEGPLGPPASHRVPPPSFHAGVPFPPRGPRGPERAQHGDGGGPRPRRPGGRNDGPPTGGNTDDEGQAHPPPPPAETPLALGARGGPQGRGDGPSTTALGS